MEIRSCALEGLEKLTKPFTWKEVRVFVTGAAGFVGGWLVRALRENLANVVVLIHNSDPQSDLFRSGMISQVKVVNGRLEDFGVLEQAINENEIEVVLHLGAQTLVRAAHRTPLATLEANIRGTANLLEACRLHSDVVQRVVVASSDKAYGEALELPYTEDMPLHGRHPYEVSKSCADLIAQMYHHTYGVPVCIVRCGNIYGGGDLNWSRIVPGTIRSLSRGERPIIRSDGQYVRDYIYVEDVVNGYIQLAKQMDDPGVCGQAFNFGNESKMTVMDMVQAIQRTMGTDLEPIILDSAPGELRSQYLSAARARQKLGWAPQFSLEAGLKRTVDWYANFLAG